MKHWDETHDGITLRADHETGRVLTISVSGDFVMMWEACDYEFHAEYGSRSDAIHALQEAIDYLKRT